MPVFYYAIILLFKLMYEKSVTKIDCCDRIIKYDGKE